MTNEYNEKLAQQGRKRRARLLRLSQNKSVKELAKMEGVSGARIRYMLGKAREEK
jgi:transposase